ncbi:MAG: GIY-YIG nuclease family protein [Patescibacteria group bacterium]
MKERSSVQAEDRAMLPQTSGVYFFLNEKNEILYIGKATNLRTRVSSYFYGDMQEKRGPLIATMITQITRIEYIERDSTLEAHLIQKYQPPYNSDGKSDRSFVYLIITKEDFPRLIIKRHKEILEGKVQEKILYSFGPFSSRHTLEQALKIIRKIFPFYTKRFGYDDQSNIYEQMGLAPGTRMNKDEYRKNINHIKLFFEGKKQRILRELEKQMMKYAKDEAFEKAEEIKNRVFALNHIRDVALIGDDTHHISRTGMRIEAYDVAHLQGKYAVGVMTVLYDGEIDKSEYRKFRIKSFEGSDDNRALQELLTRRFGHPEWELPKLIVADGSVAQKRTVERFIDSLDISKDIKVVACKKDERHKVAQILGSRELVQAYRRAILLANSEAHRFAVEYHRELRARYFTKKKDKK